MKYILFALLFLIPQFSFAYTYERIPADAIVQSPIIINIDLDTQELIDYQSIIIRFDYLGLNAPYYNNRYSICINTSPLQSQYSVNLLSGTIPVYPDTAYPWEVQDVFVDTFSVQNCDLMFYTGSLFFEGDGNNTIFTINAPTIIGNGFTTMLSEGESVYTTTTGASMGATVSWAGDSFIKIIIGSGLAVLLALRFWIVAIIAISIIVWYVYRMQKLKT
jgi:hypothetical protein